MAMFLNTPLHYKRYKKISETTYFVDKSPILNDIFECMEKRNTVYLHYKTAQIRKNDHGKYAGSFLWKGLALMITGEGVDAKIDEFAASAMELKSRDQIYSAMVVYGLLTYSGGKVFIPNRELMFKYEELLQNEESLGYVYQLAK